MFKLLIQMPSIILAIVEGIIFYGVILSVLSLFSEDFFGKRKNGQYITILDW